MKKTLFWLAILSIFILGLGCSFFGEEEEEEFQLIVENNGKKPAIIKVYGRYAGRAYPHDYRPLGYYKKSRYTPLEATSEQGDVFVSTDKDTRDKETYVWKIYPQ